MMEAMIRIQADKPTFSGTKGGIETLIISPKSDRQTGNNLYTLTSIFYLLF
jgi:hypothetical protein